MSVENLMGWSQRMLGARLLLLKLKDNGVRFTYGNGFSKDDQIYTDAEICLATENPDNMDKYLSGNPIVFYDHQRDKKGKLTSVKARFLDKRFPDK